MAEFTWLSNAIVRTDQKLSVAAAENRDALQHARDNYQARLDQIKVARETQAAEEERAAEKSRQAEEDRTNHKGYGGPGQLASNFRYSG